MLFSFDPRTHRRCLNGAAMLIAVLLSTGTAMAQPDIRTASDDQFFSVSAAIGYSRTAFKQADAFSGIEKASSPQYRAQLDYRLHRFLSVSAAMNLLGGTAFRGISHVDGNVAQSGEISSMSAEAAIAGHLPLTKMSALFVRAGGAYINTRQTQVTDGNSTTSHANTLSPFTGVGVEVDLQSHIGFRMGMDWYFNAGDPTRMGEGAIQAAYGGFVFRFR
ncbi:MAG: hypothetical protein RRA94_04750 [Bacteroidota bacterium]|nr:hypothetical protein [Bacteroidota bacterium]